MTALAGYRTHILVGLYLASVLYQIVTGEIALDADAIQQMVTGAMVSTIRAAMATLQPKV